MTPDLPPPRHRGRYAVTLVCLGNICRSPIADVVLTQRVEEVGLAGLVTVTSCGTGGWHVGETMDPRAAACLLADDYDPSLHRARPLDPGSAAGDDLVLAMDHDNLDDLRGVIPGADPLRVRLYRDLDPVGTGGEVPDPYYGGEQGFQEVLAMVERTSAALVGALQRLLTAPADGVVDGPVDGPVGGPVEGTA